MSKHLTPQTIDALINQALAIEDEQAQEAGALGFIARAMVQATLRQRAVAGNKFERRARPAELIRTCHTERKKPDEHQAFFVCANRVLLNVHCMKTKLGSPAIFKIEFEGFSDCFESNFIPGNLCLSKQLGLYRFTTRIKIGAQ